MNSKILLTKGNLPPLILVAPTDALYARFVAWTKHGIKEIFGLRDIAQINPAVVISDAVYMVNLLCRPATSH